MNYTCIMTGFLLKIYFCSFMPGMFLFNIYFDMGIKKEFFLCTQREMLLLFLPNFFLAFNKLMVKKQKHFNECMHMFYLIIFSVCHFLVWLSKDYLNFLSLVLWKRNYHIFNFVLIIQILVLRLTHEHNNVENRMLLLLFFNEIYPHYLLVIHIHI